MFDMNKILFFMSVLFAMLIAGCDSGSSESLLSDDSTTTASAFKFPMPERIRTSRAVNLDATRAIVSTNAGDVNMVREGNVFVGSIDVEFGSIFSYTLSIVEKH